MKEKERVRAAEELLNDTHTHYSTFLMSPHMLTPKAVAPIRSVVLIQSPRNTPCFYDAVNDLCSAMNFSPLF